VLSDGAAYDPERDSWRRIRPAPVPIGIASGALLQNDLYLLAVEHPREDRPARFVRYRLDTDTWDELPEPDGAPGGLALTATDSAVLAYQRSQEAGAMSIQTYDPVTVTWRSLPADPLAPSYDRTLIWTGQELVLIGIRLDPRRPANRPPTYSAAVLSQPAVEWGRLPDSEIAGWDPSWFWSGGRIVNPALGQGDGGETDNWGRFYPFGGMLTPGLWTWSPLPTPPVRDGAYHGLALGGPDYVLGSNGWVLHVLSEQWAELAMSPVQPSVGETAVWAGDRLFVWGGIRWKPRANPLDDQEGTLLAQGAVWSP
jgi:hypothetical protein